MKGTTIRRSMSALALIATAQVGVGSALAATHSAATAKASKAQKFTGSSVSTRWGPVQVVITVKNKKITNVTASSQTHTARSSSILARALPILKQETLQAQSATIDQVSGATDISDAYKQSLQYAITTAQQKKALA